MKHERKNNLFKQVPVPQVRKNHFDLSHEVKMSGKFGFLYPVLCIDTLPGDTIRDTMQAMVRFAPMLAPVMHRVDVTTHFFFVPNRLLTNHWEDFITGGQDGTAAPVLPYFSPDSLDVKTLMNKGTLWDYLGLPVAPTVAPGAWSTQHISALGFRACAKIWNDYYRDPNFDSELDLELDVQGDVGASDFNRNLMQIERYRRAWEKDYFTSALEQAQRGEQVLIPLTAEVTYRDVTDVFQADGDPPGDASLYTMALSGSNLNVGPGSPAVVPGRIENIEAVENASTTINDFRRAIAVQRWLEANARGGARYTEQILQHFNEQVPDYRLQRAEYLGGGKQAVVISEVLATAESENVPVGDMMGHGLSVGRTNRFNYRCKEHGFVIGFLSVVPRTAYQQGVAKMWLREDKFEYGWPELANLGEQEIVSKEVYYSFDGADDAANNLLFGYIPRYAEYKFHNDRVAGDFRDTLAFWQLGRIFTARPVLDATFTTMNEHNTAEEETYRRIFAVQDGTDYLWMQLYHHLSAVRPLPYFGVPSGLS